MLENAADITIQKSLLSEWIGRLVSAQREGIIMSTRKLTTHSHYSSRPVLIITITINNNNRKINFYSLSVVSGGFCINCVRIECLDLILAYLA